MEYNTDNPKVYKWNNIFKKIVADLITYYDDTRATAPSKIVAQKLARRSSSRSNFLGLPDATIKRTCPSLTPDVWVGVIVHTINNIVIIMVSQSRWDNTCSCIF